MPTKTRASCLGIRASGIPAVYRVCLLLLAVGFVATSAHAIKIRELCEVQGARNNILKGVGIVVGLAGSGDKAPAAIEAQRRMLERMGIDVQSVKELKSANVAIVAVTATLPAFAKEGTRLDVKVDSLYDAKSLEGGMLLETHLTGPGLGDTVYAVAQGPVSVGGFNADATGGTRTRKNHVTSGRIPMGAYVEREVPSTITDGERLVLLLKKPDFSVAEAVQQAIDKELDGDFAVALGGGAVRVTIPEAQQSDLVKFIARLEDITVNTPTPNRIVINERTGTIVVGGGVMIKPCQVAHGSLTIRITTMPQVTPASPFTESQPVVTQQRTVEVEEQEGYLMPVEGTSAAEVAAALNRLRVTPRDMISIFQALREAGALEADLEIM
jgi:flagellar P-ring protein precursor FlgI